MARLRTAHMHAHTNTGVCPLHVALLLYLLDGSRDLLPRWHTCTLYNRMNNSQKIRFARHGRPSRLEYVNPAKLLKVKHKEWPQGPASRCP